MASQNGNTITLLIIGVGAFLVLSSRKTSAAAAANLTPAQLAALRGNQNCTLAGLGKLLGGLLSGSKSSGGSSGGGGKAGGGCASSASKPGGGSQGPNTGSTNPCGTVCIGPPLAPGAVVCTPCGQIVGPPAESPSCSCTVGQECYTGTGGGPGGGCVTGGGCCFGCGDFGAACFC